MATLMRNASVGTAIHEWMHSWFQGMMGTNEQLYPWMDEGFTNYAGDRIFSIIRKETLFPHASNYRGYYNLVKGGWEEPMSTPADHFGTNYASATAAYAKGAVFMAQLGYIVGEKVRDNILLEYYRQWRFKHPNPNDFIRVAEKTSGMQLNWYKNYWVNTTKTIDYAIDSLWDENGKTKVRIRRVGDIPMPIDLQLTFKDSSKENHYIPLNLMFGEKPAEDEIKRKVYPEWKWTHRTYVIETDRRITDVVDVEIDPSQRLADIDRRNNLLKIKW
jgi:aminopeptidase N